MLRTRIVRAVGAAVLAAPLLCESAWAQTPTQSAAEASFSEGVKLMKDGRCEEAVDKFRESERLDPASGTLLNLAYCEARLGRVASAWLDYRKAIPLAQQRDRPQHEKIAREQADKLEPELPRLSVAVAGPAERAISVELDGESLPKAMWSVPVPVDPGSHRVQARLEGGRDWEKTITLAKAERASVEIPASEPAPPAAAAGATAGGAPAQTVGPAASTPSALSSSTTASGASAPGLGPTGGAIERGTAAQTSRPAWALAVGVAGGAAVVAGVALFTSARVQYDSARANCDAGNVCRNTPDADHEDQAISRFKWSVGVTAGGVALAAVGAIFYFTGGKSQASAASGPVVTAAGRDGWGLGWRGRW